MKAMAGNHVPFNQCRSSHWWPRHIQISIRPGKMTAHKLAMPDVASSLDIAMPFLLFYRFFKIYHHSLSYLKIISEALCLATKSHCKEKTTHIQEQPAEILRCATKSSFSYARAIFGWTWLTRPEFCGERLFPNYTLTILPQSRSLAKWCPGSFHL